MPAPRANSTTTTTPTASRFIGVPPCIQSGLRDLHAVGNAWVVRPIPARRDQWHTIDVWPDVGIERPGPALVLKREEVTRCLMSARDLMSERGQWNRSMPDVRTRAVESLCTPGVWAHVAWSWTASSNCRAVHTRRLHRQPRSVATARRVHLCHKTVVHPLPTQTPPMISPPIV